MSVFSVFFLLITVCLVTKVYSRYEFTNVKCECFDKKFCEVDYCYIKSKNRTYKYISVRCKLLQIPLTNIKVNFGLYQRLNGYKPFLYNMTVDACKFLKSPQSNPVANYFYNYFKDVSNLNHSCPFDHDIIVDKMTAESFLHRATNILPFPKGSYMFQVDFYIYNIKRAVVQLFGSLS
ncbi:uncharacterized protein [Drosophila takahashii]|uniref:uncharacterized protein n=1 Tax=Drosophila takahashii TaxID=29030 RepID=UPI001CF9093C|nr:uncharacterized protein LOC108068860 [Drosophila takahashii]